MTDYYLTSTFFLIFHLSLDLILLQKAAVNLAFLPVFVCASDKPLNCLFLVEENSILLHNLKRQQNNCLWCRQQEKNFSRSASEPVASAHKTFTPSDNVIISFFCIYLFFFIKDMMRTPFRKNTNMNIFRNLITKRQLCRLGQT